jgi:hypothetical protein
VEMGMGSKQGMRREDIINGFFFSLFPFHRGLPVSFLAPLPKSHVVVRSTQVTGFSNYFIYLTFFLFVPIDLFIFISPPSN